MKLTKRITETFHIPNDSDGAFVELRHLKINEVKAIMAKTQVLSQSADEQGEVATRVDLNPYQMSKMLAHEALVGWGGMQDDKGKNLEFNIVNVNKAAEFVVEVDVEGKLVEFDFYGWIERCRKEMSDSVKAKLKEAKENS